MKVIKVFIYSLLLFTLVSCQAKVPSGTAGTINNNKLFELKIFSDKREYKSTDKISIWSTLEYIGKEEQIKIWHGEPYIIYSITDGKDFTLDGVIQDILKSTVLEKGKIYKIDYVKSGGFSADDPKASFWRSFFAEKDLYLPPGEYTIKASTGFSLGSDVINSKVDATCELKIKVVE